VTQKAILLNPKIPDAIFSTLPPILAPQIEIK
jgi:hypothetical protein